MKMSPFHFGLGDEFRAMVQMATFRTLYFNPWF